MRTRASFKELQAARAVRERWRFREVVVPDEVMTLCGSEVVPSCFDDDDALGGVADSRLSAVATAGVGGSTRLGQWLRSRAHTGQASARRRQARSSQHVQVVDVQLPGAFPAVPPSFDRPDRWGTL